MNAQTTVLCSRFNGARDTVVQPLSLPWDDLVATHLRPTFLPGPVPAGDDPKKGLPALSPASFRPGGSRCTEDVEHVGFLPLDIDNGMSVPDPSGATHPRTGHPVMVKVRVPDPARLEDLAAHLDRRGCAAFFYSTWSSTPSWERSRGIIPLAHSVPAELWLQATEWALDYLGLNPWRECMDLPATRRAAGLWFLPGSPTPESIVRREVQGRPLDIPLDQLLHVKVPPPALQAHQRVQLEHRTKEGYRWTLRFRDSAGNLMDLRTLDAVRILEALGAQVWPERTHGAGTKHRTSCPWWQEHSHPEPSDDAVLYLAPGRWPTWRCPHSCHFHLTEVDLLESAGVLR